MRKLAFTLVAALLAGLGTFAPGLAPAANAAANPKVAIIVGATHGVTDRYRSNADQVAAAASRWTNNVVKVYSPKATWSRVKAAIDGASVVVYMGHGNGWPSPYTYDPNYTTKDGFGLNSDLNGDGKLSDYENKYFGEPYIRTLTPAKNAVVLLFHLCYASGNSEPGGDPPSLATAKKRVDNYGAAFIKAGFRAVVADGHSHSDYYMDALFTTKQTIDEYWRNAPGNHGNVKTYDSVRNDGYTYQLDPEDSDSYYRSIVGKMSLTTTQVTGAAYASTANDPLGFVVPGNATPKWDGAPVFGSVESAAQGLDQVTSLGMATTVRIDGQEWWKAWDGSTLYRVHTDDGVRGWMAGSTLVPRDSAAPKAWGSDAGAGVFSPNGDGRQDSLPISIDLSENARWTVRMLDADDDVISTFEGQGETAAFTWAPSRASVDDGTYRWQIEMTDGWGNGPSWAEGTVKVDLTAPALSLAEAAAATTPSFAPNGDGYRETISYAGGSTEGGTLVANVRNEADEIVDSVAARLSGGNATLSWDGTDGSGFVPDGRYTLTIRARDLAGNQSEAQVRTVDVYAALGFVTSSRSVFFPQDGDSLARSTTFSMRLLSPATVTWTVIDKTGAVVRTFAADEPRDAGTYTQSWDGRADGGAFVGRGTYRTEVTVTDGTHTATQRAAVVADAFRFTVSDSTPGRGQKITVTVVTPEPLERNPRVAFYQPGISGYSVATTKVGTYTYRATVTLRSSKSGTLRIKAYGTDTNGKAQSSNLYLALH